MNQGAFRQQLETSVLVRTLRGAARPIASVVQAVVRRVPRLPARLRAFDARVDAAFRRWAEEEKAREARAAEVIAASRLVRFLDWLFSIPAAAWERSWVARVTTPLVREFRAQDLAGRLRVAGQMVLVALAARIVVFHLLGETAGWVTWSLWGVVALGAILMTVSSRELEAAWQDPSRWTRRRR